MSITPTRSDEEAAAMVLANINSKPKAKGGQEVAYMKLMKSPVFTDGEKKLMTYLHSPASQMTPRKKVKLLAHSGIARKLIDVLSVNGLESQLQREKMSMAKTANVRLEGSKMSIIPRPPQPPPQPPPRYYRHPDGSYAPYPYRPHASPANRMAIPPHDVPQFARSHTGLGLGKGIVRSFSPGTRQQQQGQEQGCFGGLCSIFRRRGGNRKSKGNGKGKRKLRKTKKNNK